MKYRPKDCDNVLGFLPRAKIDPRVHHLELRHEVFQVDRESGVVESTKVIQGEVRRGQDFDEGVDQREPRQNSWFCRFGRGVC